MKKVELFNIEKNIISCEVSYRGGSLKVNVSELFPNVDNPIMGAYQNYLGGGIAGSICGGSQFDPSELSKRDQAVFKAMSERLKKYFYGLNNGGGDDYMQENVTGSLAGGYKATQKLPVSGY